MKQQIIFTNRQKGVATISYIMGLMALLVSLLAPVFNDKSAVQLLAEAIKKDYAGYEYAISGKGDIQKWIDYLE
ncbi:MAG: hypothetical protein L3J22_11725 [Xanthomonadales bacterium]|nr:hypothetical protein [Xanthomonadales bacterium]